MSRLQRNTTKVNCQYCGEEFTANGIKMHERNCPQKPEDLEEETLEEETLEELEESGEEEEEESEEGSDDSEDSEEEQENADKLTVRCVTTQSLFYYTGYINLKAGESINLDRVIAKELLRKGLVEFI
jgi:hypothetical protein